MVDVSFIIRTLNEGKTIEETLQRIYQLNDNFTKEIIIVDSGSTDNTMFIANKFDAIILSLPKDNWSWGRALNLGIEKSSGNYVVIISAHCFLSKKDFLTKSIELLRKDKKLAAVYGRQLPILNIDPFEEYELRYWFPDNQFYTMDFDQLNNGNGLGISNACCVLKKDAWLREKFDEQAQSLEDSIWAYCITRIGYNVAYTSRFSVYHSHKLSVDTIYRRWFSRFFVSQQFYTEYGSRNKTSIKMAIKKFVKQNFLEYMLFVKYFIEKYRMKKLLKKYLFINDRHINAFLHIRNKAMIDANNYYCKGDHINYWTILIPKDIKKYEDCLIEITDFLETDYSCLPEFY